MTPIQHAEYIIEFINTYFSYSEDQQGLRESACLEVQFQQNLILPEHGELLCGKFNQLIVGFGMQEAGMGYYFDRSLYESLLPQLPADLITKLEEALERWIPETGKEQLIRNTPKHILKEIPNDRFTQETNIGFWLCRMSSTQLDFDKLLILGIPGLISLLTKKKESTDDAGALTLYSEMIAGLEMFQRIILFCREQVLSFDAKHREKIAAVLKHIATNKPETFHQSVQLMYLYAVMSGTYNYGRLDEYLGDFLAKNLNDKTITREQAKQILICLWKLMIHRKTTWDGRVIVGGRGRRNEKNADEVALLAMEVAGLVRDTLPQFSLRFYEGQNKQLLEQAYQVIGTGCVYPMLYNDDVNIPSVQKAFQVPFEEAVHYLPFGCGEYILNHRSVGTPSDIINLLKALEITLFNGYDWVEKRPMGLKTGEFADFKTFDDFFEAYCKQVDFYAQLQAEQEMVEYQVSAKHSPFLFCSMLYDDCIERGKAIFDGGARYCGGTYETYGNINTADSLTAIKKLVFEEKKISPQLLLEMIRANFEGFTTERKMLLNCPKYGNDSAEADEMAQKVHEHICLTTKKQAEKVGLHSFLVVVINNSANTSLGQLTLASPDGRMAFEPMANANNPAGGRDKNGLTAMLNSLVKLPTDIHAGAVQNIKFSKEMFSKYFFQTKTALDIYFKNGGAQVMITVLGREDLENALKNPEKYANLIVRVGGFCARYVELDPAVQQEILSRTMY